MFSTSTQGTLNLQRLVDRRQQDLDFFVLYSSIASIFGNQGQASYSAANDFLNSFAEHRRYVCGKPCLSICWGALGGAGMLDRNLGLAAMLENAGFFMLNIDQGKTVNFTSLTQKSFVPSKTEVMRVIFATISRLQVKGKF